jgi:hypothetical protein
MPTTGTYIQTGQVPGTRYKHTVRYRVPIGYGIILFNFSSDNRRYTFTNFRSMAQVGQFSAYTLIYSKSIGTGQNKNKYGSLLLQAFIYNVLIRK